MQHEVFSLYSKLLVCVPYARIHLCYGTLVLPYTHVLILSMHACLHSDLDILGHESGLLFVDLNAIRKLP